MIPSGRAVARTAELLFAPEAVRPSHRALVEAVLAGRDALGVLPMDPGKSLLGQLVSLWVPESVRIIASSAEVAEELGAHSARRMDAARRGVEAGEHEEVLAALHRGSCVWHSGPEELAARSSQGASVIVIEAAHRVSPWGHDFRPEYAKLSAELAARGRCPVLALTGAATRATEQDIVRRLGLREPCVRRDEPARSSIGLIVERVRPPEKLPRVLELLNRNPSSGFVIAASSDGAVKAWTALVRAGVSAGLLHGGLDAAARQASRSAFLAGRARVLVSAGSPGLPAAKLDAGFVVHWDVPDSLETYADQLGCAGRDGAPAVAVLLYQRTDASLHRLALDRRYPGRAEVEKACAWIMGHARPFDVRDVTPCASPERALSLCLELERLGVLARDEAGWRMSSRDGGAALAVVRRFDELRAHDERRLEQMLSFAEQEHCRPQAIHRYFGERAPERCGTCDTCTRPRARGAGRWR